MAIMSGDKTMLRLCQPGEDPHSYMGAQMSQYEYRALAEAVHDASNKDAKRVRQSGKVGNLSCQYRIGVPKLLATARVQHGMDWSLADAERVYKAYHSSYRGVKQYWDKQVHKCQRAGYAETLAGRRVILNGNWRGKDRWQLESTAVNFPIQGIGADQKYLAMASIKKLLAKYDGSFLFELHDGLYSVFPDAVAHEAALAGKHILDNLPYERVWGFKPPIPLPWDIKIGPNWGDMIEL
jgi:DNA polymerase-1